MFIMLTLPAQPPMPARSIVVQVSHVRCAYPNYEPDPQQQRGQQMLFADRRMVEDGCQITIGDGEEGTFRVVETFAQVTKMIGAAMAQYLSFQAAAHQPQPATPA